MALAAQRLEEKQNRCENATKRQHLKKARIAQKAHSPIILRQLIYTHQNPAKSSTHISCPALLLLTPCITGTRKNLSPPKRKAILTTQGEVRSSGSTSLRHQGVRSESAISWMFLEGAFKGARELRRMGLQALGALCLNDSKRLLGYKWGG